MDKLNLSLDELFNLFDSGKFDVLQKIASNPASQAITNPHVHNIFGACYSRLKEYKLAIAAYRKAIELNDVLPEPYNNLGITLLTIGELTDAKTAYEKAIQLNPAYAEAYNNLGNYYLKVNDAQGARAQYEKSLFLKPDYVDALKNITNLDLETDNAVIALSRVQKASASIGKNYQLLLLESDCNSSMGNYNTALALIKEVLGAQPTNYDAYIAKANILHNQKRYENAASIYRKVLEIDPLNFSAKMNLALTHSMSGNTDHAIHYFISAFKQKPNDIKLLNNYGLFLQNLKRFDDAERAFTKASNLAPEFVAAINNLGRLFYECSRYKTALTYFNRSIKIRSNQPEIYNNIGNTLIKLEKTTEAIRVFDLALEHRPNFAEAFNHRSVAYINIGETKLAIRDLQKALALKPDYAQAHKNLTRCKKYTGNEQQLVTIKELLKDVELSRPDKVNLKYAMAKILDDCCDYKEAYQYYEAAGNEYKEHIGYKFPEDEVLFSRLIDTSYKIEKCICNIPKPPDEISPIFIIGMPRSGTTLVEQIISSHSEVTGLGELPYAAQFGGDVAVGNKELSSREILNFRERYLKEVRNHGLATKYFTDKMPHNFRISYLISRAFPDAKLIHVTRDRAATCWSNFTHFFPTDTLGYNCTLSDTIKYLALYEKLMHHYSTFCDYNIVDLDYEQLVENTEGVTRALITSVELSWEDACLSPEKNTRSVRTASSTQVRDKVYKGSSAKWKNYRPYIGSLFDFIDERR